MTASLRLVARTFVVLAEGSQVTTYRYTGQRWDSGTGLYFYNARWYDAAIGRFRAADTIVPQPGDPQSLNRYAYSSNNPIRYSDPTGFFSEEQIMGYLGVDNWDAVLDMFENEFAGAWGWLEVLRDAELRDTINMWLDTSMGWDSYSPDLSGVFAENDAGDLVINTSAGATVSGTGPVGILQSYDAPIMRINDNHKYIWNKKHTHVIFRPENVEWLDTGLDAVGASGTVGYAMLGAGAAAVTAGTGGFGLLLSGVVITGIATATDSVSAGKAIADYQREESSGVGLMVDMSLTAGGALPYVGPVADTASLIRDLLPGVYLGP